MSNIDELKEISTEGVYTHSSIFHADDVFSAALLKVSGVIDDYSIISRVASVEEDKGLTFDIGGGRFDHHQTDARVRSNGSKYAAFGLLWEFIGDEFISNKFGVSEEIAEEAAASFDKDFVERIDLTDNFGQVEYPNPISCWVRYSNGMPNNNESQNSKFIECCKVAEKIIIQMLPAFVRDAETTLSIKSRLETVDVSEETILVNKGSFVSVRKLNEINPKIIGIISKSPRGGFNLTLSPGRLIPEETMTEGRTFRHASGFMAVYETEEAAIKAAKEMAVIAVFE